MTQSTIWTIGYEQSTVDSVIGALRDAGVEVLADIRYLPLSRRPGFSKSSLAAAAREAEIEYRHIKPLGTPAEGRSAARRGDHAVLKRVYSGQLELPEALPAMAALLPWQHCATWQVRSGSRCCALSVRQAGATAAC